MRGLTYLYLNLKVIVANLGSKDICSLSNYTNDTKAKLVGDEGAHPDVEVAVSRTAKARIDVPGTAPQSLTIRRSDSKRAENNARRIIR